MKCARLFCWPKSLPTIHINQLLGKCDTGSAYQKLCPHFVMCASSIISKQMGLQKKTTKAGSITSPKINSSFGEQNIFFVFVFTNQTKSLLLSSYEFKRPLQRGVWWRDFFLLPEEAEGLLSEAKPPRDDGTAAKVGTDKPPSLVAAAKVREGTTFPELPLLVTALLPPPPLVFPVPPALLLLLVPGTALAPPACCCCRLLDIVRNRQETPWDPLCCCSKHPDSAAIWLL